MKSIDFIKSAIDLFYKKKSTNERYDEEINWLHQRKDKWTNDKVRIGVIGVTSSGKSTLINAILGEELLATAVKPSSSQLVSCSRDSERKAIISFRDKNNLTLADDTFTLENLKKYSDEAENPNNFKEVSDIQLITPKFDLGNQVVLIDSAGLDAYKLEYHEKLTLEVLLPTIDICILVTTLKTNSDAKTKTVLNSIAKHNCPLIIVQNMLDSVEASADGSKTKEMVAIEHINRLKKIISQSTIKNTNQVKVVQVSALMAMKARSLGNDVPSSSNYNQFKSIMEKEIEEFLPLIDKQRNRSINSRFEQFIKDEEIQASSVDSIKTQFKFEGIDIRLNKDFEDISLGLTNILSKISSDNILKGSDIKKVMKRVRSEIKDSEIKILNLITNFNDQINFIAQTLDIPLRDILAIQKIDKIPAPIEILQEVTKYRSVKKKSLGSKVSRVFGSLFGKDDWGYEEESYSSKEIDEERTYNEVRKYRRRSYNAYKKTVDNWLEDVRNTVGSINEEIHNLRESHILRQEKIEERSDVIWLMKNLKQLLKDLDLGEDLYKQFNGKLNKDKESIVELSEVKISNYQLGILNLSRILLQKINSETLKFVEDYTNSPKDRLVMSWDLLSMNNFSWRFFGNNLSEGDQNQLIKDEKISLEGIDYVLNPDSELIGSIKEPTSFFIMINAHQDGAAKNELSRLNLSGLIKKQDKVFFVVQDFDSLINSGGVKEMKRNLLDYFDLFGIENNKGVLLINDSNPIFNLAFVQSQIEPCESIADEQELISMLRKKFSYLMYDNTNKIVADLIRGYKKGDPDEI